jgi:hypothetical protein
LRIREFSIRRYGPLGGGSVIPLAGFNLLYGRNEIGKSLTIDAIVRMLLEKKLKSFDGIDRVNENPDGYVILETAGGEQIRFPGGGELEGLDREDFRNIFITRNSDLAVSGESGFYTSVSNKLTGLRTDQIERVVTKLREIGEVTQGDAFLNTADSGKLKDRLEGADALLAGVAELEDELKEAGFDEMEEKAAALEIAIEEKKKERAELEDARMRVRYEKGAAALERFSAESERFDSLSRYSEEKEREWDNHNRVTGEKRLEIERASEEVRKLEKRMDEEREKLRESEVSLSGMEAKQEHITGSVRPALSLCRERREELAGKEASGKFWKMVSLFCLLLLAGAVVLSIILRSVPGFAAVAVAAALSAFALWKVYQPVREKARLEKELEKLRVSMSEVGLQGKGITDIYERVNSFEETFSGEKKLVEERRAEMSILERDIARLKDEVIPACRSAVREAEREIERIRAESGAESLDDYRAGLAERKAAQEAMNEQKAVLKSMFGQAEESGGPEYWSGEIARLRGYAGRAEGVTYSLEKEKECGTRIAEMERELSGAESEMRQLKQKLREAGVAAAELLPPEEAESALCSTLPELKVLAARLRNFIESRHRRRDAVLGAIDIFREIENEEREKVSELFGEGRKVSEHFRKITAGAYREVNFDHLSGTILVTAGEGRVLEAGVLSGGAYDQLYFSIRLALGEELLGERKGFFILDDPFIKSDTGRLREQMQLLGSIAEAGWQILFFSAKEEVRDALAPRIEEREVTFIDLESVYGGPAA